jgi:outer membrane protein OmpA-like peptidoglycan-associated protein
VDRSLLAAVGMGPDEPVADNSTESGRARNRRVEIHILPAE